MSAPRQPRRLGDGRRGSQPEPLLSTPNEHAPRRRGPALAIVAAIAGTGLVVGGGFVVSQVLSSGPDSRPAANGSSSAPTTPPRDEPIEPTSPQPTTTPSKKAKAKSPSPRPTHSSTPVKTRKPTAKPPARKPKRTVPPVPSGGMNATEAAVFTLTNKERAKAGCPALRADNRLVLSARRHSADMAANNYFSHNSQDGTTPWKRMERAGYPSPGAENIAKGYATAAAVMKGWMNSPGHRANILNCKLRALGVGMAKPGPIWTQNFGWK